MPTWTRAELDAFERRRKAQHPVRDTVSVAEPEPTLCHEPLGSASGAQESSGRFRVHVESRRVRLLDLDNLIVKHCLDCCRYVGAIRDDRPEDIELTVIQTKVNKPEECTVITVTEL